MTSETFADQALSIVVQDADDAVRVLWFGVSMAREPGRFILPVLAKALQLSTTRRKPIIIDFRKVEYLNSSTITPLIRILELARRGSNTVTVLYRRDLKWQELNFTALGVFRTEDGRIDIRGD